MRILCLHGNGTNSDILQLQIAPLRHELEDGHEYEFVEATLQAPASKAHGVEALATPDQSFYAYYDFDDLSTLETALDQLNGYVFAEGPFDVILGFSAGAVLAAVYLLDKERQGDIVPFKCGIFLSSADCKAETSYLGLDMHSKSITIPTAHIWGCNDELAPTGGEDLGRMCDPACRRRLVHDGGHEIPRKGFLTEMVHLIRRTIHSANH
ncbi:serine hydrolase FSH [Xylariaceae sp. FL0662B]|nr:serine hydrolase FSH [Xylariaceae sp. FL0662B]